MEIKELDNFKILLKNIQHIKTFEYNFNLTKNTLFCIVGKNSVGKTTLIKAIQNFKNTNTIDKLSRINIINSSSSIEYSTNHNNYKFNSSYNNNRYVLDIKDELPSDISHNLHTELPMPNDIRTKVYQKFNEDYRNEKTGTDTYKIQANFATQTYEKIPPLILRRILNFVYSTNKFNNLEQINIRKEIYYLQDFTNYYLREDDFSSGEYMIVQIYKLIQKKTKMIVIDEIDISLDSSAQVKFIRVLKCLCKKYKINIIFTTHSLAIMKIINEIGEDLLYMDNNNGNVSLENRSYNFIKAELFQFSGFDKILLTEDQILVDYLEYLLTNKQIFKIYKIIKCKSESETIHIMNLNKLNNIFGTQDVKIILDGDVKNKYKEKKEFKNMKFSIFNDLELEVLELYNQKEIDNNSQINDAIIKIPNAKDRAKCVFKNLITLKIKTKYELFDLINKQKQNEVKEFINNIVQFLNI
jgi:ABC-type cobalamin/Fe3+-siderophores transport system ATPase subunit